MSTGTQEWRFPFKSFKCKNFLNLKKKKTFLTLFSLSFHQMPKLVIKNHLIASHLASAWIIILMSNPLTASPGRLFHFVTAIFVKSTLAESAVLVFIPGSISGTHREKNKKLNFFPPMTHIFTRLTPSYLFSRPNICRSFHCFSCDVVFRAYTILGLHLFPVSIQSHDGHDKSEEEHELPTRCSG